MMAAARIWAIALNTFREASRNRILYGIAVLAFCTIMFGVVLGEMSLHQEARVARDVGLSGVSLFGALTAIVLGVSLLYGEIERRTVHSIVSKPVHRYEFVLGKYLGMALMLTLLVLVFIAATALLLTMQGVAFSEAVSKAVLLSYVEVLLVAGVAVFFSSFSTPYLSGIFTLMVFVAGRSTGEMRRIVGDGDAGGFAPLLRGAMRVLPDFHLFSVSGSRVDGDHVTVHSDFVGWDYVLTSCSYGLIYLAALLALASVIISRRDFA